MYYTFKNVGWFYAPIYVDKILHDCSDHLNTFQESNDGEEGWHQQAAAGTRRTGEWPQAGAGEGGAHGKLVRKKKKILVVPSNDKLGIGFFSWFYKCSYFIIRLVCMSVGLYITHSQYDSTVA